MTKEQQFTDFMNRIAKAKDEAAALTVFRSFAKTLNKHELAALKQEIERQHRIENPGQHRLMKLPLRRSRGM
jgi:hypothetical protein